MTYRFLQLASLITFTFGALTFLVLTLLYVREPRKRDPSHVFPFFTFVCAAAFAMNLLLQATPPDSAFATGLLLVLKLITGLLPPLLLHLVYREERRTWKLLLVAFYAISSAGALLQGLEDAELISTGWGDWLDEIPPVMLVVAGALGLLAQQASRRSLNALERRHRAWIRALLILTMVCGMMNIVLPGPLVHALPDYLVLGFFCVTLYYKERLVFFDLVIKRGAFFALALVGLTLFFTLARGTEPLIAALLLVPFWLMSPWIYSRLTRAIDHVWLRRKYSSPEAERKFVADVQVAANQDDLRHRAAESLSEIFQAPAHIHFDVPHPLPPEGALQAGMANGSILLDPRANYVPYLSDDLRLIQSLARTLGVVLENVRFREQQEQQQAREQHLRLLASRAELKALRAQINPHFLFNALNAIAGLIPDQPALADETVEQLAEVFRYTLRKSENEWVRFDEELEFVAAYLRVERARFGDRLKIDFDLDPHARAISIPAMTIQPLVENAIRHGVSALETCGTIRLRSTLNDGLLQVEVFDNGPGFPPGFSLEKTVGHGLRNITERLKGYYGGSAELCWDCGPNGTRIVLKIPRSGGS